MNKELIDSLSTLLESIALVVGGLWVAWTFRKLQKTRAAEGEIARTRAETEKGSAEVAELHWRQVSQQPNLLITFSRAAEHRTAEMQRYLSVEIELRNSGSRMLEIRFDEPPLRVGRYDLANLGAGLTNAYTAKAQVFSVKGTHLEDVPWRVLRVGQARRMGFLVGLDEPGIYLLEFRATYFAVPFEGENQETLNTRPVTAIEQRVTPVGMKNSTVTILEESGLGRGEPAAHEPENLQLPSPPS